jgi:hypothetical protein
MKSFSRLEHSYHARRTYRIGWILSELDNNHQHLVIISLYCIYINIKKIHYPAILLYTKHTFPLTLRNMITIYLHYIHSSHYDCTFFNNGKVIDFKNTAEELLPLLERSSWDMTKTGSVGCQAISEHLYR